MLARMNFAAQLATNQKFNLRDASRGHASTPEALVSLHARPPDAAPIRARRRTRARSTTRGAGGAWTGSDDADCDEGRRARSHLDRRVRRISVDLGADMPITQTRLRRGGVAAFTVGFAAPAFLSRSCAARRAIARAIWSSCI